MHSDHLGPELSDVLVCNFYKDFFLFICSTDTVPLLSGEHMFETVALEIEQLLAKVRNFTVHIMYGINGSCHLLP
jgi:hypothetical protein